jgi:predicted CopG family antitoxin
VTTVNESSLKTVRIDEDVHKKIMKCGKMGESMNDVISRIVDYYIERELSKK